MTGSAIRVGLTDDEPLFSAGLAMLLGSQVDMEVVWVASSGYEALSRAQADPVDVLLLDVQMPGLDGLETTRQLISAGAQGKVVILTTFDTDGYVLGAIEAGAAGFLLKSTPPDQLLEAVRVVRAGDSVISPGPTRRLLTAMRQGAPATSGQDSQADKAGPPEVLAALTERESQVLRLVALGHTNQEICERLWLSMATVKTHVSHLLSKTGSRDRVQLVLLALRSGAVSVDDVLSTSAGPA